MTSPSRTPRTDEMIAAFGTASYGVIPEAFAVLARQLETELSQSRDDALEQAKELAAMRLLAAEPYSIQKVKDELGPISLWTQDGLREEIKRHVDAALKTNPAPIAAPIASGDALDALRYRWLRQFAGKPDTFPVLDEPNTPEEMDASIDAARNTTNS